MSSPRINALRQLAEEAELERRDFLYESTEFTGRSLLLGGLRVGYNWGAGRYRYELAAFGRNITNQVRVTGGIDFNNLTGFVNDSNPRVFGAQFTRRF